MNPTATVITPTMVRTTWSWPSRSTADPAADDALPVLVGHVSLALAQAAHDEWLADPTRPLPDPVGEQMLRLRDHLALPGG